MKKVVAIIQARMGSTRLPGKVMKDLCGKTVLAHDIERVRQSKYIDEIVIATTKFKEDDIILKEVSKNGAKVYRGSEDDVLRRYYEAAKENKADVIVRITSDCPLIDPFIVDEVIKVYLNSNYDLVTNAGVYPENRTYPRGLDVEVFSFDILKKAFQEAIEMYQREHVTPFIYENSKNIYYYKNNIDYSKYRWTLDTEEDYKLISAVYDRLYENYGSKFGFKEILELIKTDPELIKINIQVEQKMYTV